MTSTVNVPAPSPAPSSEPFIAPGRAGSLVNVRPRYDNFIGGHWVAPVKGQYMTNLSPVDGKPFCEVARSTAEDVELALDAAHAAKDAWGETSLTGRAAVLNAIADAIEANLEMLSPAPPAPWRDIPARSTRTPSPITSTSRWVWWDRSSRSTSRC